MFSRSRGLSLSTGQCLLSLYTPPSPPSLERTPLLGRRKFSSAAFAVTRSMCPRVPKCSILCHHPGFVCVHFLHFLLFLHFLQAFCLRLRIPQSLRHDAQTRRPFNLLNCPIRPKHVLPQEKKAYLTFWKVQLTSIASNKKPPQKSSSLKVDWPKYEKLWQESVKSDSAVKSLSSSSDGQN